MLKNYLKIALRNLMRHRIYSAINVFGLAIGMACCLLILAFVQYELSFDRFHQNADSIYRITYRIPDMPAGSGAPKIPAPVGPMLHAEYPHIQTTRILPRFQNPVHTNNQHFKDDLAFTDATFFSIFTFPLTKGNPKTALSEPYTAVINESIAKKYFGDTDPIGQILSIDADHLADYRITGVMKDMPANSHFQFDILTSFQSLYDFMNEGVTSRTSGRYYTYALLPKTSPQTFSKHLLDFSKRYSQGLEVQFTFALWPMTNIHLYSQSVDEMRINGDIAHVYLFSAIACFVLLIACINFTNLATARSAHRAREVGLRKVVGAYRLQLIGQFIGESLLLALGALIFALALTEVCLPILSDFLDRDLKIMYHTGWTMLSLVAITVLVGLLAGSYPALFLSRFIPSDVLKGRFGTGLKGVGFRRTLVITQFVISVILVIATGIVLQQQAFVQNKNLGFDRDLVIAIKNSSGVEPEDIDGLRQIFLKHADITHVSTSTAIPGKRAIIHRIYLKPKGATEPERQRVKLIMADADFIDTYGIELISGRNFDPDRATDRQNWVFLLNETAVNTYGWAEPLGKEITFAHNRGSGTVVGIVKDFHFESLHHKVKPLIIAYRVPWGELYLPQNPIPKSAQHHQHLANHLEKYLPGPGTRFLFCRSTHRPPLSRRTTHRHTAGHLLWHCHHHFMSGPLWFGSFHSRTPPPKKSASEKFSAHRSHKSSYSSPKSSLISYS